MQNEPRGYASYQLFVGDVPIGPPVCVSFSLPRCQHPRDHRGAPQLVTVGADKRRGLWTVVQKHHTHATR